jgi:hypothetical protein
LIYVEAQAALLIANEYADSVNAKIGVVAILRQRGLSRQTERRRARHGGHYKTTRRFDQRVRFSFCALAYFKDGDIRIRVQSVRKS